MVNAVVVLEEKDYRFLKLKAVKENKKIMQVYKEVFEAGLNILGEIE